MSIYVVVDSNGRAKWNVPNLASLKELHEALLIITRYPSRGLVVSKSRYTRSGIVVNPVEALELVISCAEQCKILSVLDRLNKNS